ncbi:MAG: C13 family peptidase [Caulobacteraceae bacterium]|nr:C13 family peptidase [Caulobacteraceae bacterium]
MARRAALLLSLVWIAALGLASNASAAGNPFAAWAAIVVAGDWRAHDGEPSEVFDNARHDLAKALVDAGFSPGNIRQFSVHPERYAKDGALKSDPEVVAQKLAELTQQAPAGCLIYFTSHGSPDGIVVGDGVWAPGSVGQLVDQTCSDRPTVVIVAACFAGVFVPAVDGPNRMVLTAARPDRASFGCGQSDHYTYFDACLLQALPHAKTFLTLAPAVKTCVAQRETEMGASPPSEPQFEVGGALGPMLALYPFKSSP